MSPLRPCRYLYGLECKYWDLTLTEDETLRCLIPGGWSENCYEPDNKGVIFENGKWMTVVEYVDYATEENRHKLPDMMEKLIQDMSGPLDILKRNKNGE
jgi:hypothetical protein